MSGKFVIEHIQKILKGEHAGASVGDIRVGTHTRKGGIYLSEAAARALIQDNEMLRNFMRGIHDKAALALREYPIDGPVVIEQEARPCDEEG